ncbi:T3HPD-like protein [Mya arenaria]|uniref:trans-L-3-hydroxyproline dehydratase n=1 Tax=Mya arenaria TaxID=6604 RepID=A0ABY7FIL0_MYAAR|nr:trans-L-3-hydroxyproline dehydratase-like [Mya arenaria]WAR21009.1 T3HPD-like protein [Mya arenaria]
MLQICTTDLHCGGGTVRVVRGDQLPVISGNSLLEKRNYFRDNLDYIRKFLLHEPRGHEDLYGIVVLESDDVTADVNLILLHNAGYGSMCGHGALAMGRFAVDTGIVRKPTSPETEVRLRCPCGIVRVFVQYENGRTGSSRFISVPSFVFARDVKASVQGYGDVTADVCYGGAFFVHVKASLLGLDVRTSSIDDLIRAGDAVTRVFKACVTVTHPDSPDLAFIVGTNLVDDNEDNPDVPTAMVCIFADKQVERSPCGSGSAARIAQLYERGHLKLGETRQIQGPTGDCFKTTPIKDVKYGEHNAVIVEVEGRAYYAGKAELILEEGDEIGKGFLLR